MNVGEINNNQQTSFKAKIGITTAKSAKDTALGVILDASEAGHNALRELEHECIKRNIPFITDRESVSGLGTQVMTTRGLNIEAGAPASAVPASPITHYIWTGNNASQLLKKHAPKGYEATAKMVQETPAENIRDAKRTYDMIKAGTLVLA